ncbi:hypothetical protein JVT61DRAFT_7399 [Boletus reticuloceps]|uniref:Transcription regulator Rua1 C-terminal domain-containing protein n=1 Tax=Boletus reticuloceps TaxID=495285 RepID=A0A8I2YJ24_9AGAM|nr:hypothetical protein JVT61DRAFT_7399 [Boletus reticuloceps]
MPKSFYNDLSDNLVLYKGSYTFYQASPSLELTQDTATCLSMLSTPNRVQGGMRSLGPTLSTYSTPYPPMTSTPRSLVTPSTSSLSIANMQFVFSPSPLPVSQVPSLVFPEISPPSQGSGSTPFERQFVGEFSREWININTHISPVARRNPHFTLFSPTSTYAGGTPSRTDCSPTSQDSQDAVGRVSLIDRFISAAADESAITEHDTPSSTFLSQNPSSPLSDLSDLTPLSSPESSDRFRRGLNLRSSSPPTSPTEERHKVPRQSNIRYTGNSGRQPPSPSTRSSCSRDSDYLPAKGTAGCKRKRASRSRDGDEIPSKRKKIRTPKLPESTSTETNSSLEPSNRRRLPTDIPYHSQFSLLYLRFPVSSYLRLANGTFVLFIASQLGNCSRSNVSSRFPLLSADSKRLAGTYNEPRDALDLYTPRFVKGCGATKVGVCPICIESPSRGGKGEAVWLSMKFSAYKWHVSSSAYTSAAHFIPLTESCFSLTCQGISSVSARPFSPPVAFRTTERQNPAKNERTSIQEGKCHKCRKWILVESIKNIDIKVKELYWYAPNMIIAIFALSCAGGNTLLYAIRANKWRETMTFFWTMKSTAAFSSPSDRDP